MSAQNRYREFLSTISMEQLQRYVANAERYDPIAVEAAIEEFAQRGHPLTPDGISQIQSRLSRGDNSEPVLYSSQAVAIFSVFMSPLFGSIMFVSNLIVLKRPQSIAPTIIFGIVADAIAGLVQSLFGNPTVTLMWNAFGAGVMYFSIWPKFIGLETGYKSRSIWLPFLVAVLLFVGLIWMAYQVDAG